MPGSSLAETFVEVGLRAPGFAADVERQVEGPLKEVARTAEQSGEKIERSFKEAGTKAGTQVEGVAREAKSSFAAVSTDAAQSGEKIERSFKEASTSANRHLDSIDEHGKKSAGSFGLFTKVAVGFAAALAVGTGLAKLIASGRESIRVQKITESVVASTGGVAKVTAGHIGDLATSISNLTGIDDEAIQANANVLLTFTNLRNEVGQGNDVFDQATRLAQDMATVLGTDAAGSALQLGKALNDPVKGITALARAGVSFTEDQKAQIKTLAETGDILGAQKIILGEVSKEFGGAAAAAVDPFARLGVVLDNLKETIGMALIPLIAPAANALSNFISDSLPGLAAGAAAGIGKVAGAVGSVARAAWPAIQAGAEAVGAAFGVIVDLLGPLVSGLGDLMDKALTPLGDWMAENTALVTVLATAFGTFAGAIVAVSLASKGLSLLSTLGTVLSGLGAAIALGPFVLIAAAIVAIGAAGFVAYQKFKPFRDLVDNVAAFFVDTVVPALKSAGETLRGLGDTLGGVLGALKLPSIDFAGLFAGASDAAGSAADSLRKGVAPAISFVTGIWQQYGDEVTGILSGLGTIIAAAVGRVVDLLTNLANTLMAVAAPAFEFVAAVANIAFAAIQVSVGAFVAFMQPVWSALWGFFSDVVTGAVDPIRTIIEGFLQVIQGVVDIIAGIFTGDWQRVWDGFVSIASGAISIFTGLLQQVLNFLSAVWSNAAELITAPFRGGWAAVQAILEGAINFLGSVWSNVTRLITAPIEAAIALAQGFIGQISAVIGELPGKAVTALADLGSSIAGAIADAAVTAVTAAGKLVTDVLSKIGEIATGIPGKLASIGGTISSNLASFFKGWWNSAMDRLPSVSFGGFEVLGHTIVPSFDFDPGSWLHMALGGIIPGAAGQGVPIVAHGGELMLNSQQQARVLLAIAQGASAGGRPTFEFNGPVTFGADTSTALDDLDWFALFRMRAA